MRRLRFLLHALPFVVLGAVPGLVVACSNGTEVRRFHEKHERGTWFPDLDISITVQDENFQANVTATSGESEAGGTMTTTPQGGQSQEQTINSGANQSSFTVTPSTGYCDMSYDIGGGNVETKRITKDGIKKL